jgi:hypothetical protein
MTDGDSTVARHFAGDGRQATRAAAHYCDTHGLRIVCLSTPETVYRDMQGTRAEMDTHLRLRITGSAQPRDIANRPETTMLGGIGRLDLLEGRFV